MAKLRTLADVEQALQPYVARSRASRYTLDTVRALAAALGNPQDQLRVIHIAGTSGKTTTSYYIARLLTAAGCKVGLTVSPHIVDIRERAQIFGVDFAEADFVARFDEYFALVRASGIEPSYFELMMVFAYWLFAREKVDYAVIETGLGGLLDASNICRTPDKLCVITDIGYDHTEILGDTLTAIAGQKAGIIAPGNAVVMYQQGPEVMTVVEQVVQRQKATLQTIQGEAGETFMVRNFRLATTAYQLIATRDRRPTFDEATLVQLRETTVVPGRVERLQVGQTTFTLDGAHNPQKMTMLLATLDRLYGARQWSVLYALKAHKDAVAVSALLASHAAEIVVTEFHGTQDTPLVAVPAAELAQTIPLAGKVRVMTPLAAALEYYCVSTVDLVLVTGSFYLVAEARAWLIAEKQAIIEQ